MGSIHQLSPNRAENNEVEEHNQHIQYEHKEVRDGIFREGQGLSEEDESRNNEALEDVNNKLAQQAGLQKQPQQPPGPIVHWERFLPVRALKILLVENDDSTSQVVSALLHNCSYEVTAAANGMQAWKILEDLTNHIDLVLTEVFMPGLCGISLLSKIMSHKTCRNIPVIMMSSNDSMGTVFKCLSKGAVDFLVKPIRKNELKNLWQHVWRRCHSSSGSGSESGIQTQKSVKSKIADDSENNSGSNDDDNGSSGLNARDGSDNGSGTQNSCTKRAVEVEGPQCMSPSDQIADPLDSTCAQVIYPNPETFCNDWVPMSANGECQGQKEPTDELMGKDLEIGVPRNTDINYETYPTEKICSKLTDMNVDKLPESDQKNEGILGLESNNVSTSDERSSQAVDLIGAIANNADNLPVTTPVQPPNGFSKFPECQDKITDGSTDLPSLELSLKRLRSIGEYGSATHDDRTVLRRSKQSAFSRYHKSATLNRASSGYGGNCSPLDNSSEARRAESTCNMISSSNAAPLKQGSNGSSNNNVGSTTKNVSTYNMKSSSNAAPLKQGSAGSRNNDDMGSTTKNVFTNTAANKEKTASTSALNCIQTATAFRPTQIRASTTQQAMQEKTEDAPAAGAIGQARGIQRGVQVQHHHHHYHHHHLHVHSMQQQQHPPDNNDELPPSSMAAPAPQCWSSNAFVGQVEGNATNYSINGLGRNHGSNGHNGSSTAAKPVGLSIQGANGNMEHSRPGGGNASGSGSGSGVDQIRFAQREAALKKFRQKRKERNFSKKVRYQSRKRLAEQRPRVRGQFVRQTRARTERPEGDINHPL